MERTDEVRALIDLIQKAIDDHGVLHFSYQDREGASTTRNVQPLGLWFWDKVWTLVAWYETRRDFRMFRLDRTSGLALTGERFRPAPERSLAEWAESQERGERTRPATGSRAA